MHAGGRVRQSQDARHARPAIHAQRAECHAFFVISDLLAAGDFAAQKDH
jgi:hypothetical protein